MERNPFNSAPKPDAEGSKDESAVIEGVLAGLISRPIGAESSPEGEIASVIDQGAEFGQPAPDLGEIVRDYRNGSEA